MFILLKSEVIDGDAEVEFASQSQTLRVKPVHWNDRILCVDAPGEDLNRKPLKAFQRTTSLQPFYFYLADFPAGDVAVTVYSNGAPLSKAQLRYYSNMEEISNLLAKAADPVDFMCQVKTQN